MYAISKIVYLIYMDKFPNGSNIQCNPYNVTDGPKNFELLLEKDRVDQFQSLLLFPYIEVLPNVRDTTASIAYYYVIYMVRSSISH